MSFSRREFLETAALGSLAAATLGAAETLPTRVLGKTGVRVPILGMGAGSRFLLYKEEDKAVEAIQKGLDLGITYIDTADSYGKDHLSEQWVGKAIRGRSGIFLATKLSSRDGNEAERIIEQSLKALQVDRVDLILIHELTTDEDLARVEAKGGALDQLMKLKDKKLTRFTGITSHGDPMVYKTAIERHDFDCAQMPINAARSGMVNGGKGVGLVPDMSFKDSFETLALPVAIRKKMGVLAIKVYGQDHLTAHATPEQLLHYALSLPVTSAIVGMPKLEQIEDNVRLAKAFKPMPPSEMKQISDAVSGKAKVALDRFFANHVDA
jgi:predicted aldo/keto reductase-like oxidoreductase